MNGPQREIGLCVCDRKHRVSEKKLRHLKSLSVLVHTRSNFLIQCIYYTFLSAARRVVLLHEVPEAKLREQVATTQQQRSIQGRVAWRVSRRSSLVRPVLGWMREAWTFTSGKANIEKGREVVDDDDDDDDDAWQGPGLAEPAKLSGDISGLLLSRRPVGPFWSRAVSAPSGLGTPCIVQDLSFYDPKSPKLNRGITRTDMPRSTIGRNFFVTCAPKMFGQRGNNAR